MSRSAQPHEHIFYLDECLGGNKVRSILEQAGIKLEVHDKHFPRGTPDEAWLPVIGKNGWVLLTQDKGIKRHKSEILALREHNVKAFIISAKGLRGEEIGELIVKSMPKILRVLKNTIPPLIATIDRSRVVELKEGRAKYGKKK